MAATDKKNDLSYEWDHNGCIKPNKQSSMHALSHSDFPMNMTIQWRPVLELFTIEVAEMQSLIVN